MSTLLTYIMAAVYDIPTEQIEETYNRPTDYCNSFQSFMDANGITEDTLTPEHASYYFEMFWNHPPFDRGYYHYEGPESLGFTWINEMLESHDPTVLLKELNKKFWHDYKKPLIFIKPENTKSFLKGIRIAIPNEFIDDGRLDEIINEFDKFMWIVTSRDITKLYSYQGTHKIIQVEPAKREKCTNFVKDNCHGIIYHVTTKNHKKEIDKIGLRCKGEKRVQRYYTNRIYFICIEDNEDLIKQIKVIQKSFGDKIPDSELLVYKFDISKTNIDFYRDSYDYPDTNAIYTYSNLPSEYIIKSVDYEHLKKLE